MKYRIHFTEVVAYSVDIETDNLADVAERWQEIDGNGDFDPLTACDEVQERELGAVYLLNESDYVPDNAKSIAETVTDLVCALEEESIICASCNAEIEIVSGEFNPANPCPKCSGAVLL